MECIEFVSSGLKIPDFMAATTSLMNMDGTASNSSLVVEWIDCRLVDLGGGGCSIFRARWLRV